jgi:hypothetical protein
MVGQCLIAGIWMEILRNKYYYRGSAFGKALSLVVLLMHSGWSSADRHCSEGLGLIVVSLDEIELVEHSMQGCEVVSLQLSVWLSAIVSDFEVCGCFNASESLGHVRVDKGSSCLADIGFRKKYLLEAQELAKSECEY